MALNLLRESRLFVSTVGIYTNDDQAQGAVTHTTANTWELPVLSGFSFSQATENQEVTLSEAGVNPLRGKKVFNTQLNPVEFSFTTYIRPFKDSNDANKHKCVEAILWEALVGSGPMGTNAVPGATKFVVDFENSNVNQLMSAYLFFEFENTTYFIEKACLNTAEVDFSIDGIAQVAWSGFGSTLKDVTTMRGTTQIPQYSNLTTFKKAPTATGKPSAFIVNKYSTLDIKDKKMSGATHGISTITFASALVGTAAHGLATGNYGLNINIDGAGASVISIPLVSGGTIDNVVSAINTTIDGANVVLNSQGKLVFTSWSAGTTSTIALPAPVDTELLYELNANAAPTIVATNGTGSPKIYSINLTGGSLSIDNGISYLTPEELGVLNTPIGYFTSTRNISGNVTAYLNTGSSTSSSILTDMLNNSSITTHEFEITVAIGGRSNTPRVEFRMPHVNMTFPAISTEDVMGLDISFSALGQDITVNDELFISYYANATEAY
jgi:hypothetical protein